MKFTFFIFQDTNSDRITYSIFMFMRHKLEYKRRWGDFARKFGAQKVGRFPLVGAISFRGDFV